MAPLSPSPGSRSQSPARRLFVLSPETTGDASLDGRFTTEGSSVDIALHRAQAGRQQVPTLTELASVSGFNREFPNIGRILRGAGGSRDPTPSHAVGVGSLASAVAGNPYPGIGLSAPSSLRPGQLIRGGPVSADKLPDGDTTAQLPEPHDRRFAERCGRIRRADKAARLAGTLQSYIDAGQHGTTLAQIAQEESRWLQEREQLVRGLERDLRDRGYRTSHRLHDAAAVGQETGEVAHPSNARRGESPHPSRPRGPADLVIEEADEVTWKVAADHGEKTLQGSELARKMGATSKHVWAAITMMAEVRKQEQHNDEFVDTERKKVSAQMRSQGLEIASKSAIDKENLLRNMRWSRRNALEISRAREQLEYDYSHSQRVGRVKAVFKRLSQATSSDQLRLARCVDAVVAAAEAERLRLESLAGRLSATATM